jgi:hypothetical protein
VEGIGMPIAPLNSLASTGLAQTMGDASVSP